MAFKSFPFLAAFVIQTHLIQAIIQCPFLGPDLPAVKNLANSPTFQKVMSFIKNRVSDRINTGILWPNQTSFSVEIFSSDSSTSLFKYHYAAPMLSNTNGTKIVNSDSIYRIGSISKLFTVYTFLIEVGDVVFHESITKYVPELLAAGKDYQDSNAANMVD